VSERHSQSLSSEGIRAKNAVISMIGMAYAIVDVKPYHRSGSVESTVVGIGC
jgi:hypothetical protein